MRPRLRSRPSSLWLALALACASTSAWAQPADGEGKAAAQDEPQDERSESQPRTMLVADLVANNVDEKTVDTIDSLLAGELAAQPGLSVVSGSELRRMLEFEAERQQVGCESDASCLAEVAGAMGAELLVTGQVGTLGTRLILTLTLMDVKSAKPVGRSTIAVDDVALLPEKLHAEIPNLVAEVVRPEAPAKVATAPTPAPASEGSPLASIATIGGYGALGTGGLLLAGGVAAVVGGAYLTATVYLTEADYTRAQGWDKGAIPNEAEAIDDLLDAREAYGDAITQHNELAPLLYWIGGSVAAGGLALTGLGAGALLLGGGEAE